MRKTEFDGQRRAKTVSKEIERGPKRIFRLELQRPKAQGPPPPSFLRPWGGPVLDLHLLPWTYMRIRTHTRIRIDRLGLFVQVACGHRDHPTLVVGPPQE